MIALYNILLYLVVGLYVAAGLLYIGCLFSGDRSVSSHWATRLLSVGVVGQVAALVIKMIVSGRWPLATVFEASFIVSLCLGATYLFTERRIGHRSGGLFILPLVTLFMVVSIFGDPLEVRVNPVLQSGWFGVHTLFAIGGYAAFFVGAQFSLMYLLLFYRLKSGAPGAVYACFPPLETLDRLIHIPNTIGYVGLSLGMFSGAVWAYGVWGSFLSWDPKQVAALFVWLWYTVYLHARYLSHWSTRRSAYLSLGGVVAILFTFFLVHVFFRSVHEFV